VSALRHRDVVAGPPVRAAVGSALDRLAARALAIPAGPGPVADLSRVRLLREARIAGARCRADGADIIGLVTDFQAYRAELRRRPLSPDAPAGAPSTGRNERADALLDDVLVAIVRGYEGRLEPEPPSTPPDRTATAHRRPPARSLGSSKRE
jgi:hypothetical protein